jgi:hypothetical protein
VQRRCNDRLETGLETGQVMTQAPAADAATSPTGPNGPAAGTVPSPGQLVTVRNRRWVAADVARSTVASSDPQQLTAAPTHLVSLVSIEDDARDDELRVVWELEYGPAWLVSLFLVNAQARPKVPGYDR